MHCDINKSLKNTNTAFVFVDLSEIQGRRNTGSVMFYTTAYRFAQYFKVASPTLKTWNFGAAVLLEGQFPF